MGDRRVRDSRGVVIPGPQRLNPVDFVRSIADPRPLLAKMTREYGDLIGYDGGGQPVVITGHPEAIRAVFTAEPDALAVPLREKLAPFFGERSLILTSGPRHRQDRRLLAPPFHGARMRAYGQTIVDTATAAAARLPRGTPFAMLDVTQGISLEVILRAVFGVDTDQRRARFREAIVELMAAMASPLIVMFEFTRRELGGVGPWARFRRATAELDKLVYDELASRRERPEAREDVLSLLMAARYEDGAAMSDKELRDQLHLLLFAGHDTTSTALAWAFYWLHRHAEDRERLLAELDALGPDPEPDAVAALPFLDAVCQETLRIHPVATEVARLLQAPLEILGYSVPAGTMVSVSAILLHDREELYPEPRAFRPARFLERRFSPFEFIPFGGGARRCIGAAFALYEMKLVLATLLRAHRFRLGTDAPVKCVRRGLTMGPKGGVSMVLEGPR